MRTVDKSMISAALGLSERGVMKRADREGWKFEQAQCRGGCRKEYLIKYLPAEVRVELAKHHAATTLKTQSPAAVAGAGAGSELARQKAADNEQQRMAAETALARFAALADDRQAVAYARADVLAAWDGFLAASAIGNKKRATAEFARLYNAGEIRVAESIRARVEKVSWTTLTRWQAARETDGLLGLAPSYHNPAKGTTSLAPEMCDFILGMLQKAPHASVATITMAMEARFARMPGATAIRRYISRWKSENESLLLWCTNPDKWRNKHLFAVGDASERVVRLNQLWEFDSTPTDVMLADGRHTLIGVVDVYSRRGKLHVSKTSKSTAVASLTRRALLDWGVPEIAKTDNGADYVSNHMVTVFSGLGIEQKLCPPFTPQAKPHIERFFKTFAHSFQELMPGYIGHSVADRKDIEARRSFASRIMAVGEEPVAISMTAEELQDYCNRWCKAVYEQNKHRALSGRSPAEVARAWRESIRAVGNHRALDILLAEAPSGGTRVVTKTGISVDNITYIADSLPEPGTTVRVKLDATDLGTIYLFDSDGNFLCVAQDPMRTGIDRAEVAAKLKARQQQFVREGQRALKKIAREQALDSIHDEILEHRERQVAKIVPLPHRTVEHTTPEIEAAAMAAAAIDGMKETRTVSPIDQLLDDIEAEQEVLARKEQARDKITPLLTDADIYQRIFEATRGGARQLTRQEYDWLAGYYQSSTGKAYRLLQGNLLETVGLAEAHQIKA